MKTTFVLVIFSFSFVIFVEGLKTCDPNIINKIISRKDCPTHLLKSLHSMTPFTYVFNPKGTVPDRVRCAKGAVDHLRGSRAEAHVTVEYKVNMKDLVQNYRHEEISCGHIREFDEKNNEFHIYSIYAKPCFCYYRCTTYKTEGDDFAACAVPIASQSEKAVRDCVQNCRRALAAVGVQVVLGDMTPCTK